MKIITQLLHSPKEERLTKRTFELPELLSHQFIIKTKYCGICRNDIAGYIGQAFRMPMGREGHEGLGTVIKVHEDYKGKFKIGDFVSTFDSDPAFSEFYYSDDTRACLIPELSPNYILEPVACAINITLRTLILTIANMGKTSEEKNPSILLTGSGFMSILIKQYCKFLNIKIDVAGSSNQKIWETLGVNLKPLRFYVDKKEQFDAIIDLSGHGKYYDIIIQQLANIGAVVCMGSTPKEKLMLDFDSSAWKDLTYVFPSPRSNGFLDVMNLCVEMITKKVLTPEILWTKGYNFNNIDECIKGFEDGKIRASDYVKGYFSF